MQSRLAAQPGRLLWRVGEVAEVVEETPRTKSLMLSVPGWEGHTAGQHLDVRLTAPDGYQAQRSYSIASAPEDERLAITVDRIEDGEVSPYLTGELMAGDGLELRGPIGGYFAWEAQQGGPLLLVVRIAEEDEKLEVVHTLTRSQPEGWEGYARRIDEEMLREISPAPSEKPLAFVCGPTPLVESGAAALVELGHDPNRVKTERFGPSGG